MQSFHAAGAWEVTIVDGFESYCVVAISCISDGDSV